PDSLISTIKYVVPKNSILSPARKLNDAALQEDLSIVLQDKTPGINWQSVIMMQSIDEAGGLKFKVPQLSHPVTFMKNVKPPNDEDIKIIPSRLVDILKQPSSINSEFQILLPFGRLKSLELELHWNPIKNITLIKHEKIIGAEPISQVEVFEYLCCPEEDDVLGNSVQFLDDTIDAPLEPRNGTRKIDQQTRKMKLRDDSAIPLIPKHDTNNITSKCHSAAIFDQRFPLNKKGSPHHLQHTWQSTYRKKENKIFGDSADIRELLQTDKISRDSNFIKQNERNHNINLNCVSPIVELTSSALNNEDKVTKWLSNCRKDIFLNEKEAFIYDEFENLHEIIDLTRDENPCDNNPSTDENIFENSQYLDGTRGSFVSQDQVSDPIKKVISTVENASQFFKGSKSDITSNDQAAGNDLVVKNFDHLFKAQNSSTSKNTLMTENNSTFSEDLQNSLPHHDTILPSIESSTPNGHSTSHFKVLKALAELQVILTRFPHDVHIIFSPCEEISARLARIIGDLCAAKCEEYLTPANKKGWADKQQWENRDWMAMEESL
ncbi:16048_t:CDS:2, partial [Acaulospora colombiana]